MMIVHTVRTETGYVQEILDLRNELIIESQNTWRTWRYIFLGSICVWCYSGKYLGESLLIDVGSFEGSLG